MSPEELEQFTPEQKEVLSNIYKYQDSFNLTEKEYKIADKMFNKPENFAILRKILQDWTPNEKGISVPDKNAISTSPESLAAYGLEVAVKNMASELIRKTLVSFYHMMKEYKTNKVKKVFSDINTKKFEEEKLREENESRRKSESQDIGEHL